MERDDHRADLASEAQDDPELRRFQQQMYASELHGVGTSLGQACLDFEASIAAKVRQLRAERGWSQAELAKQMTNYGFEMSQGTVAKLETNRRPIRAAEVYALAAVFRLPLEAIWYVRAKSEPRAIAQMRDELQEVDEHIRVVESALESTFQVWLSAREARHDIASAMDRAAITQIDVESEEGSD